MTKQNYFIILFNGLIVTVVLILIVSQTSQPWRFRQLTRNYHWRRCKRWLLSFLWVSLECSSRFLSEATAWSILSRIWALQRLRIASPRWESRSARCSRWAMIGSFQNFSRWHLSRLTLTLYPRPQFLDAIGSNRMKTFNPRELKNFTSILTLVSTGFSGSDDANIFKNVFLTFSTFWFRLFFSR